MSTPLIGSKISLISKSEIRYEGILYTVDPEKSTIALAKVRSFGSEDRRADEVIPPRKEVFEYIIFKATDIKDLLVRETPQPAPFLYNNLHYDPAILSVSNAPTDYTQSVPGQQQSAHTAMAPQQDRRKVRAPDTLVSREANPAGQIGSQREARDEVNVVNVTVSNPPVGTRGYGTARRRDAVQRDVQNRPRFTNNVVQLGLTQQRPNFRRRPSGGRRFAQGAVHFSNNYYSIPRLDQAPRSNNNYAYRGFNWHGSGAARGAGRQFQDLNMYRPKLFYRTDYDFEEANKEFAQQLEDLKEEMKKVKVEGESGEETEGTDENANAASVEGEAKPNDASGKQFFYDKEKSFFDNISCDGNETATGTNRMNYKTERELNHITFGIPAGRGYGGRRTRTRSQSSHRGNQGQSGREQQPPRAK